MTGVTVREASSSELDAVYALYRDLHDGDETADPAALAAAKRALAASPCSRLFVADAGGELVSSCVLFVLPNLSRGARPFGLLENVVTRRDCRNRGFGTALLRHALACAWAADCYKVMLLTGRTDPAVSRLYEKAGFLRGVKTGLVAYPPDTP